MKIKIAVLLFSVSLVALVLHASCTGKKADAYSLRFGYNSEPTTFDPLSSSNTADGRSLLFNVFEGLVKPDTDGNMRPCVAESVTMEELGRVYNFQLRKNIRFHDGSRLTSADVKFSLETAKTDKVIGFNAVETIETNGDYSVKVTLLRPDPEFLPYLTVGIVKANSADRDKKAIGTGPYLIESYAVQRELVLKKFADYWQDNVPILEKIKIVFLADSDAIVRGLLGKSIDGASLTGSLAQQLNTEQFDIIPGYTSMVHLLALNNTAPPLNDIRVRQAINYGVDIQGIIDTAFYGKGEPSGSPLIPGLKSYYENSLANPYPADPEKARSLLKEAGYGEGGKKLSLEITVPSLYTMHVDTAQVIADQLAKIGIDVSINLVEWGTWLSDVYQGRKYQATVISLDSPVLSPRSFLSRYRSDANNNFINYSSADFDRVFDAILVEPGEDKRVALYKEAQRIISGDAASVYIQDILQFRALRAGAYGGVLNYPLYVNDFSAMYTK